MNLAKLSLAAMIAALVAVPTVASAANKPNTAYYLGINAPDDMPRPSYKPNDPNKLWRCDTDKDGDWKSFSCDYVYKDLPQQSSGNAPDSEQQLAYQDDDGTMWVRQDRAPADPRFVKTTFSRNGYDVWVNPDANNQYRGQIGFVAPPPCNYGCYNYSYVYAGRTYYGRTFPEDCWNGRCTVDTNNRSSKGGRVVAGAIVGGILGAVLASH